MTSVLRVKCSELLARSNHPCRRPGSTVPPRAGRRGRRGLPVSRPSTGWKEREAWATCEQAEHRLEGEGGVGYL